MNSGMHMVFVYGTLKRGEPNHHVLVDPSLPKKNGPVFIGEGRTVSQFPLIIASDYNIPFVLDAPGSGHKIRGEIWEVNEECLRRLDILEAHPDYYIRREVEVELLSKAPNKNGEKKVQGSKTVLCEAYFLHDFHEKLLSLPLIENYSSYGSHGLRYTLHEDRHSEQSSKSQVKKSVENVTKSFDETEE